MKGAHILLIQQQHIFKTSFDEYDRAICSDVSVRILRSKKSIKDYIVEQYIGGIYFDIPNNRHVISDNMVTFRNGYVNVSNNPVAVVQDMWQVLVVPVGNDHVAVGTCIVNDSDDENILAAK